MNSNDEQPYDEDRDSLVGFFSGPTNLAELSTHLGHEYRYTETIRAMWAALDRFEFEAVAPLLHDEFVCEWPQSRERIVGRDNFVAVNANYPGRWHIVIQNIMCDLNQVVTECDVTDGNVTVQAISFFTIKDDKIIHIREYWPDEMEAQAWRSKWVELF